ncbi:uncharacterized protein [Ptychodera flava]|uniref:uncharacterized protein isoform X2 n=1 Tax=Ptychodera flava TaxID=63121 RepID=UPI00396A6DBE
MATREVLELLSSSTKLERDRGLVELQRQINDAKEGDIQAIEMALTSLLQDSAARWEQKQGALLGSKLILVSNEDSSEEFALTVRLHALHCLNDSEARVRLAAGEVMGALCRRNGPEIYLSSKDIILEGVQSNLERHPISDSGHEEQKQAEALMEKLSSSPGKESIADAAQIFHDTAGWKNLETWMKCLQCVIEGCGVHFSEHVTQDLVDLIFQTLTHTNRFVRETGFQVCAALVSCGSQEDDEVEPMESESMSAMFGDDNPIMLHGYHFAQHLADGLADNWSQVRLSASVATRQFVLNLPNEEARQRFFPALIPRMCLNRYYVAEGVRIYSQETWRRVTGTKGKEVVETYIKDTVEYYVAQTMADNHAVREAACACIAELGSKINRECVRPYVPVLLQALLECFKDESWPVRDAACVACGNFVLCFPEESKSSMEALYPLFFSNLQDNIPSVRQGAAIALSNVAKAYGQEALDVLLAKITEGILGLDKQPQTTEKYSSMDKGVATFGVVKRLRDNDIELHTDKQMYSCGSLAPKMGRGGGCMDHKFRRPSEPWELCDGCTILLSELSGIQQPIASQISNFLPLVAEAARKHHYTEHVHFLETVCKQLPVLAKNVGKRFFKPHIELFLDPVFYSLSCDNALTSSAASQCLNHLSQFLGPNILRGRVEQYNPSYLEKLEANQFIAAF